MLNRQGICWLKRCGILKLPSLTVNWKCIRVSLSASLSNYWHRVAIWRGNCEGLSHRVALKFAYLRDYSAWASHSAEELLGSWGTDCSGTFLFSTYWLVVNVLPSEQSHKALWWCHLHLTLNLIRFNVLYADKHNRVPDRQKHS